MCELCNVDKNICGRCFARSKSKIYRCVSLTKKGFDSDLHERCCVWCVVCVVCVCVCMCVS